MKPIPRTFHLNYQPYSVDKPLVYLQAVLGDLPAFDARVVVNPILVTLRPETVSNFVELVSRAMPHIQRIQELHQVKPEGIKLETILVQEGKSPLEETFHLVANIHHVSLAFPSAASSTYVKVCLNVANTTVMSHPKLPDSKLLQTGIGALPEFPGSMDDLVFKRGDINSSAQNLHSVKFKVDSEFEWTVQFDPEGIPQRALHMPKNTLDVNVSLGHLQPVIPGQPRVCMIDIITIQLTNCHTAKIRTYFN